MGELNRYRVTVNGHETVLKLTEADAKAFHPDAERIDGGKAPSASTDGPSGGGGRKARAASNKSRTAAPGVVTSGAAPADK